MAGQAASVEFDSDRFQAALRQALLGMKARKEADLVRLGLQVQSRARELCPVDTGRLRASISSSALQHDARGAYVEVGTNVVYAGFVEFGTARMAAQPYMRPALLEAALGWAR